MMVINIS